jgi:hypothetical protein
VKRGGSLSFLVGTISNVLVMEIGWTDVYTSLNLQVKIRLTHAPTAALRQQTVIC